MEIENQGNRQEIMDFDFDDARHVHRHMHSEIELLYVLEGSITLSVSGREYLLNRDDIIVIPSGEMHSYHAEGSVLIGFLHMDVRAVNYYIDLKNYHFLCNSSVDRNGAYREIAKILDKIFRCYFEKQQECVYLNSLYFSLLNLLITNFAIRIEENEPDTKKDSQEQRNQKIVLFIQKNFRYSIGLNDLAEYLHLSAAYISKYMKKNLGMNFGKYINQVRLENAVADMQQSQKSLSSIALDSGFPNVTAFTEAFKAEYGQTPSVWRKEHLIGQDGEKQESIRKKQRIKIHIQTYLEERNEKVSSEEESGESSVFEVDAAKTDIYKKNWSKLINIGGVEALLKSDVQNHLQILKRELEFEYVRFWNVFSDEMLVEVNNPEGINNLSRLNKALDFLVENGMHPFIELGFKPILLFRSLGKPIVQKERAIPFHSKEEYANLLRTLIVHCVNRYGMQEVSQWYFEQWGDPRLTSGDNYGNYFEIFETAYHTLKTISPDIHVGGAGFGRLFSTLELEEIIALWEKRMVHPDFISMEGYPYLARSKGKGINEDRIRDPDFIKNEILMMRDVMEKVSMHSSKLLISEWSSSVSNWNSLNDSLYKGAFILKSLIDNVDSLDMMGYWMATDLLEEYYDTGSLLHGGNGLLTVDGIKKPAFYAFQFANRLGEYMLGRNQNSMVTSNGMNRYVIVCHNFIKLNYKYYLRDEDKIEAEKQFLLFDDPKSLHLHFRIRNVKNGKYIIKIRSLNMEHGSIQEEWAQMEYSDKLTGQDIEYLRDISTPKIFIRECTVENKALEVGTDLKPHEIQEIHLIYQIE